MKHSGQLMPLHGAVQHSSETYAGMWPGSVGCGVSCSLPADHRQVGPASMAG